MGGRGPGEKERIGPLSGTPPPERWFQALLEVVGHSPYRSELKEAGAARQLAIWTTAMTAAVAETCRGFGWRTAARGAIGPLPTARGEYLAVDVTAFDDAGGRWPLPAAAIELENSPRDELVAYSLWKVLSVRSRLRVVIAYREDSPAAGTLATWLGREVIDPWPVQDRLGAEGATMLVVGMRGGTDTFPYGFFRAWFLDMNLSKFIPIR